MQLTVTDNSGNKATDTMTVTVLQSKFYVDKFMISFQQANFSENLQLYEINERLGRMVPTVMNAELLLCVSII